MSENQAALFVGLWILATVVWRFIGKLHRLAGTRREEVSLLALVATWLLLATAHTYALVIAQQHLIATAGATRSPAVIVGWWVIINVVWLESIFAYYDYGQLDADRQPQLVPVARTVSLAAIIVSCAMLLFWIPVLTVPGIPLYIPAHVTLGVSSLGIFALGVFYLDAPRRARLANKPS